MQPGRSRHGALVLPDGARGMRGPWRTGSDDARRRARACHSLAVRVPEGFGAEELSARLAIVFADRPDRPAVWVRRVEGPSDDPGSRAVLEEELARPLAWSARAARLVLVQYADAAADLVLVAPRGLMTEDVLRARARDILAGTFGPEDHLLPGLAAEPLLPPGCGREQPTPEFGFGTIGRAGVLRAVHFGTPAAASVTESLMAAACALVLSRYQWGSPERPVVIGTVRPDGALAHYEVSLAAESRAGRLRRTWERVEPAPRQAGESLPLVGLIRTDLVPDSVYFPCQAPIWPLTYQWSTSPDGRLEGWCWYDEGVVHPDVAGEFCAQLSDCVAALSVGDPDRDLHDLAALDRHRASMLISTGPLPRPTWSLEDPTIHGLFEDIVASHGSRPAVSDSQESLTYRELDERARQLADGLRGCGVAPGSLVGIALDRDVSLVVAMLAVIKAGCGYVPLDVETPSERLRYVLADAEAAVVIGDRNKIPLESASRVFSPRQLSEAAGRIGDAGRPDDRGTADTIAYVIYTSGSTGRPKGVLIPHRNVVSLVAATEAELDLSPSDVWSMFHSAAFDFSVWEIWGCLLTGGHLVVTPQWTTRSALDFHAFLVAEGVTVLSQTPSAFQELARVDEAADEDLAVRLLVLGGEALDVSGLAPWFRKHPPAECRVVNMFGITETTVHVTLQTITPAHVRERSRSVGHPLAGWNVSVRDERGRVCPLGAAGEIWVGGVGVARGYQRLPELTHERFVADQLSGGRAYRSGDLGRLGPDGRLEHLGRIDEQVKVRGYRIELGEIRAVLTSQEHVLAAAVTLDADGARIDAYVVLADEGEVSLLAASLSEELPPYMMPTSITVLDALPRTANDKIDTARLLASRDTPRVVLEPPMARLSRERELIGRLQQIWSEVLKTPVGQNENFFEVGGNSLHVARVLAQMRAAGLPRIGAQEFYGNSTVAELAALLDGLLDRPSGALAPEPNLSQVQV